LVPDPGLISVGVAITREISVTATDLIEKVEVTLGQEAEGNFIDQAVEGDTSGLEVLSVTFGATTVDLEGSSQTITTQYCVLAINTDGTYTYTPNEIGRASCRERGQNTGRQK